MNLVDFEIEALRVHLLLFCNLTMEIGKIVYLDC